MPVELVTAPVGEPLSLKAIKDHLRVTEDDENALIWSLVTSVRRRAESLTGRALLTQTWRLWLDFFPGRSWIRIPYPPLQSVTSVKFYDEEDAELTFDSVNYIVDAVSEPGRIVLRDDATWPTDDLRSANAVAIEFKAGYGAAGTDVPGEILDWIRLKVTDLFEHREATVVGSITQPHDFVDELLADHRVYAFDGFAG